MKIAAVSNNGKSISAHFGKAHLFVVLTVEDGKITGREVLERPGMGEKPQLLQVARKKETHSGEHHHEHHHEGGDHLFNPNHDLSPISDCQAVLSRGMGSGVFSRLQEAGIKAVLTDIMSIDEAVLKYYDGTLQEHPELVH